MRRWMLVGCLLLSGWASAADVEYKRGDFRFFVGPEPAFVVTHDIPGQWDPTAPGAHDAPWRYWRYDSQMDRRQGHDQAYFDRVYEATSASLLQEAGRYEFGFNPNYQTLTLHRVEIRRDGRWENRLDPDRVTLARREANFEQDMADGEVTALVVIDDLRVGDVVRVRFTVTGSNPILAGQFFDSSIVGWRNPMLDSDMRVLADPGTQFGVVRENGAPEPVLSNRPDAAEIDFHVHGAPAVADEGNYPVWYQPYPTVAVSAKRSWADVVKWALPLYPQVNELPEDLKARIKSWSALPSPSQRLKAALRAVQDEVRYFGAELGDNSHRPAPPADTWTRRRGDCKDKAYLLVTILRQMGIDSAPALTSMGRGRALLETVPSAAAFDHVIVRAVVAGHPVWVDPTRSQTGGDPGSTDLSRYGAGLPVQAGVAALEPIASPHVGAIAGVDITEQLASANAGKVALDVTTTYRGASADETRSRFASEQVAVISRGYANFYRKRYGDLQVVAEPAFKDDRESNVVTVVEKYLLDSPFETEPGVVRHLDLYADAISAPAAMPSSMQRKGPLYIAVPGEYRHRVLLKAPAEWQPMFDRETDTRRTDAFEFRREIGLDGRDAIVDCDMVVSAYDVSSASAGAQLKEMRAVNDGLSTRLTYRAPVSMDAGERDRRLKDLLQSVMGRGAGK